MSGDPAKGFKIIWKAVETNRLLPYCNLPDSVRAARGSEIWKRRRQTWVEITSGVNTCGDRISLKRRLASYQKVLVYKMRDKCAVTTPVSNLNSYPKKFQNVQAELTAQGRPATGSKHLAISMQVWGLLNLPRDSILRDCRHNLNQIFKNKRLPQNCRMQHELENAPIKPIKKITTPNGPSWSHNNNLPASR